MADEELSPTARRLRDRHESRTKRLEGEDSRTVAGRTRYEVLVTLTFLGQVGRVLVWLWWNVGNPLINVFTVPLIVRAWGWYVALWRRHTTYLDEHGNEKFSRRRGIAVVLATMMVPFVALNLLLLTIDVALYSVTREERTVWLSLPQEIYPGANVFSIQGCLTEGEVDGTVRCSEDNSLYYRVRPTLFTELWSLVRGWRNGRPLELFYPDLIVSPVGASWSRCDVVTYSFRIKLLMGLGDVYPELLHADCERSIGTG